MAQNPLPKPPGALMVIAGKCKAGLVKYGTTLGITQITPTLLDTDSGTLSAAMTAFNATRAGRTAAHATLNTASAAAKKFLADGRGILVLSWGETYNQQWAAAGWTDNTTAVPNTQPKRVELVQALAGFLTANPSYAATTGTIVFTAAQAGTVAGELARGLTGVGSADALAKTALENRATADTALRADLRMLLSILSGKLTPDDPRWAEFGLNAPGAAVTPKAPTHLESHAAAGQIYATCTMPPGADHLRWWLKKPGQTAFANVTGTTDGELLLTAQTAGQTVELYAPAGESVPSPTISVAVG